MQLSSEQKLSSLRCLSASDSFEITFSGLLSLLGNPTNSSSKYESFEYENLGFVLDIPINTTLKIYLLKHR